ncbi:sodium/potassium/calcium exchanger 3-like [Scleropages formosus]|uniref:Sodium/potassium/calcium exchanger 3-like n=1 Tax=Scleropages formosus TaxID=113540 RepID=A0A0P7WYC8_SCLFO|nr:sodium/potassium/calcium exchanger 3-like [Scleropages formosus]
MGGYAVSNAPLSERGRWDGRKLLQEPGSNGTLEQEENCTTPALHEFPRDLFSPQERTRGALLLHVLCWLHLSEDVAGATFMAAGSSAPELFTSIIGVFITKGDVGVGTIVGSAVFNILCIIGICGIFAGQVIRLCCWALLRDSVYYTMSVVALILVIYDEKVSWLESLVLILMYLLYILIMKFNTHVQSYFERRNKGTCSVNLLNGTTSTADVDDAATVLLSKGRFLTPASVLMVDELLSMQPHQLSFSEASMRVMITSHFSPRTRISMASRMLISERQRLISARSLSNSDSDVTVKVPGRRSLDSGLPGMERGLKGRCGWDADEDGRGLETGTNTENKDYKNDEEEEEDEEDKGLFVPFHVPARSCDKLQWLLSWPLCLLLFLTVPNCTSPRWQRCFVLTFLTSTLWIAAFSYVMVWMVTIIGFTLGIPDVIMGITFLAAGTSVPDCMASLTVVRQGLGDMAVSNSIGSNVFDILMGLGLPWTIKTLVIDYGSYIHINSKGLIFSVELLLASVFLAVLGVHLNKWKLDRRLGLGCLLLYSVFLCFSILIEFNMFTFINKPTCHNL